MGWGWRGMRGGWDGDLKSEECPRCLFSWCDICRAIVRPNLLGLFACLLTSNNSFCLLAKIYK